MRNLGIKHTKVFIRNDDFLDNLRKLIYSRDALVYVNVYYIHWLLMRELSGQGFRVAMSGTGADELFSGYYDHNLWYLAEIYADRNLYGRSRRGWEEQIRPHVRNPFLKDPERFVKSPGFRGHIYLRADEFAETFLKEEWLEPFTEEKYERDKLRNRMLNEMFHETVPAILHEEDLNAMFFPVENRSPFLDRGLFEFSMKIPTPLLMRNEFPKAVLREAMRGIVPDKILDNPRKVGFNVPLSDLFDWLYGERILRLNMEENRMQRRVLN